MDSRKQKEEAQPRQRAYSQDDFNEHSEMIETKTVMRDGKDALSQFVFAKGFDTETEQEEDEKWVDAMLKVKPTFSLF